MIGHFFAIESLERRTLLAAVSLLKDINTAYVGAEPSEMLPFGDRIVYNARTDDRTAGLWVTDGTPHGTRLLMEGLSIPDGREHAVLGRYLYFRRDDGQHGDELWRTDGTPAGTNLVIDLNTRSSSYIGRLTNLNGRLVFTAQPAFSGPALWASDGTAAGTQIISATLRPVGRVDGGLNDKSYWIYYEPVGSTQYNRVLCVTDGTAEGTGVVMESVGPQSHWMELIPFQDKLLITDGPYGNGRSLYVSDGTEQGTTLIKTFSGTSIGNFRNIGDQILFDTNAGMWRTDGTIEGTHPFGPDEFDTFGYLGDIRSDLFFLAYLPFGGYGLWTLDRTTGQPNQAAPVAEFEFESGRWPRSAVIGSTLYLSASDGIHGIELWQSDGTSTGTRMVADVAPGSASFTPGDLHAAGSRLIFTANGPTVGPELFSYTPSKQRLAVLHDVPGTLDGNAAPFIQIDRTLYFTANKPDGATSLWKTDGTASGTTELSANVGGEVSQALNFGEWAYFIAGGRLWRSDGTAGGTTEIDGGPPTDNDYAWAGSMLLAHGRLYYVSRIQDYPYPHCSLMAIDTPTGTPRSVGVSGHDVRGPYVAEGQLYVQSVTYAPFTPRWYEIKPDGPVPVEMPPGSLSYPGWSNPYGSSITIGSTRYYAYDDGVHGAELWMDDGKHAKLVKDLYKGPRSSVPGALAYVNGHLVFAATTPDVGREMFAIDVKRTFGHRPIEAPMPAGRIGRQGLAVLNEGASPDDLTDLAQEGTHV